MYIHWDTNVLLLQYAILQLLLTFRDSIVISILVSVGIEYKM